MKNSTLKFNIKELVIPWLFVLGIIGLLMYAIYDDSVNLPKKINLLIQNRTKQFESIVKNEFTLNLDSSDDETPDAKKFPGKILIWRDGLGAMDVKSNTIIEIEGYRRDMLTDNEEYITYYQANVKEELGTVIFIMGRREDIIGTYEYSRPAIQVLYNCIAISANPKMKKEFIVKGTPPPWIKVGPGVNMSHTGHSDAMDKLMEWIKLNVTPKR